MSSIIVLLVTFLSILGCQRTPSIDLDRPKPRNPTFSRGVSLGLFASGSSPDERVRIYLGLLDEIEEVGATDVQIVTRWSQHDVRSSTMGPTLGLSPTDLELRTVLRTAHAKNLRSFLMPIIHVEHRAQGAWRGALEPHDPDAWWHGYERFILHHAKIAEDEDVDLFAIGSELVTLESQQARWNVLITQVRATYHGRITYSANWDHFEPVRIWDAVDVVGISVYPPLSTSPHPTEAELVAGWTTFARHLRSWATRTDRNYMFTEIGYPSAPFAASRPWIHSSRGPADLELQRLCYRAMFRTWQDDERLTGIFVWNWFGIGGPEDPSHTPRNKPAQAVLSHWFRESAH